MDKIEKLLRKISKSDRDRLLKIINLLLVRKKIGLDIKKVKNTDFFRLRSGRFRIIFHFEGKDKDVVIDSIKLRNESTYR